MPEPEVVAALIPEARLAPARLVEVQSLATRLAEGVRAARSRAAGVDALMHEFSLDSEEGVALMCLAEALLRIPDAATRDLLIRDKIAGPQWRAHLGASPSLFVNAAAWGLLVTGTLVDTRNENRLEQALATLLRKGGEPLIRAGVDLAMRLLGRQFVTGRTIEEALANARERESRGYTFSFDMLGEAAVTRADAERYFAAYEHALRAIGRASPGRGVHAGPGISVKLSALHPRYTRTQRERVQQELYPRLAALALLAADLDVALSVDAEEADRLELSMDLFDRLAREPRLARWRGLGFVVQAYQKRGRLVIDWLASLAQARGAPLNVRLVKGAYWDTEIKRTQVEGLVDYPVFTRKAHTDVSYLACARAMLATRGALYAQFATHNAFTIAAVRSLAQDAEVQDYEFQCLHGMGETLYDQMVGPSRINARCRIYAPVGSHDTLLGYLVRRLLENGANTSFVNRIVDPKVRIADLVADPVAEAERSGGRSHARIPLPRALFEGRRNSSGIDLSDDIALAQLARDLTATPPYVEAAPLLGDTLPEGRRAPEQRAHEARACTPVRNPAGRTDAVGAVWEATAQDARHAVEVAIDRAGAWSALQTGERAAVLERAADLFEANRPALIALLLREAGRTVGDAVSEVREAVDFCRYYAAEARSEAFPIDARPRGVIVCISPWNFPLSIFVGQIAAALVAGNAVIAKPAEQAPLVSALAVRMMHEAGVPPPALQWLPGHGEIVGAALVGDPRIAGVMFTGSTEVARHIHRVLAAREDDPVLIAETGGQNAMIVDSSALPEQVVTDVMLSAFNSAGQRCSALRILCVQHDVAPALLALLEGAMHELVLGDPRRLATDVGPVIDEAALHALRSHVERLRALGLPVVEGGHPNGHETLARGVFLRPTLIDLGGLEGFEHLEREVFGPVLHVVRWRRGELDALIDRINATGYGLTHGIHSRIDETVDAILGRIRAGNVYVNRNVIGAVVGVQPFGGLGLSGTGPKAGGPLYLRRLIVTRSPFRLPVDARIALPGPTGETNELELRARGRVACIAPDERALRAQAKVVQSLGSTAVVLRSHVSLGLRHAVDPARLQLVDGFDGIALEAVLAEGPPAEVGAWRRRFAAREGPIIAFVVPDEDGRYDAARLLVERAVTVNTAAAGGNARLLALAADDT